MDFSIFRDLPITDAHIHCWGVGELDETIDTLWSTMTQGGVERVNIVSALDPHAVNCNAVGLYFKGRFPDRVTLFGGLDHVTAAQAGPETMAADLVAQVDRLRTMGCDGIKLIEGKPLVYKWLPLSFDGPVYAPFFDRLEATGFPVIWHVNDPPTFWDGERVPAWARERGWFYGDGTFPTMETLYAQVENVLSRHPQLRVVLAHFFFLSDDLSRAAALLERYPHAHLDLTPGSEMYFNFARDPDAVRRFFLRFSDRIIYGTDATDQAMVSAVGRQRTAGKMWMVRCFLESEEHFDAAPLIQRPGEVRGIALPPEVLIKIYRTNFQRLMGERPAPLDKAMALTECQRLAALFERGGFGELAQRMPRPSVNRAAQVADYIAKSV